MPDQGIVFDLDETLIDRSAALRDFAAQLHAGYITEAEMPLAQFVAGVEARDALGYTPRETFFAQLWTDCQRWIPNRETIETAFHGIVWETPTLFPGVIDSLRVLKAHGLRLGIVTNGSDRAQWSKLRSSGLAEYFDAVVVSESFGSKKPDPLIFGEVIRLLDIDVRRSWFVGDHPVNDICGSKDSGFLAAWVHHHRGWQGARLPCYDVSAETPAATLDKVINRIWPGTAIV